MSKYSEARALIASVEARACAAGLDRNDIVEAVTTLCIQDMQGERGARFVREYLSYELDNVGNGDVFDIQKR